MTYQEEKAKRCYKLYKKGETFKKVYAAVQKGEEFIVLHFQNSKAEDKYRLAGGGVDDGETNEIAIKRELLEELNVNVEIVKSIGTITYPTQRKYKHHEFELVCEAEIF